MLGTIRNQCGESLDYAFHAGKQGGKSLVIIGHGVTGNKDRPFVVALAEALSTTGIAALRFSFSGNGQSQGRFVDSTISKEVGDLGAILDAVTSAGYRAGYAGHSMGGAVGVLRASEDPRIQFLISLAGMVHTKAFVEREFGMVKPGAGFMWDEPECPLSQAFWEDARSVDSVAAKAGQIKVPWLLVHGSEDDVVPVQDSEDILGHANEPKSFVKISGSNHVFGGDAAAKMVAIVVDWVTKIQLPDSQS